jgi:hypothetical protein
VLVDEKALNDNLLGKFFRRDLDEIDLENWYFFRIFG